jgi:hypothetical protein
MMNRVIIVITASIILYSTYYKVIFMTEGRNNKTIVVPIFGYYQCIHNNVIYVTVKTRNPSKLVLTSFN